MTAPVEAAAGKPAAPGAWLASYDLDGGAAPPDAVSPGLRLVQAVGASAPCVAEAGPLSAVFDGTLYNRQDLLDLLDAEARSSDAALVLRAWRRWGDDALQHLKGIFAVVLADREQRTLLAARDPLGIYPLFYARARRQLLLSTSV